MNAAEARDLLLAVPGITEHDHFGKLAYRGLTAKGKPSKIFLTLWVEENRAVLLLNLEQQADLVARHPGILIPVPNKWGEKGATFVELRKAGSRQFLEWARMCMQLAGCA